jgi:hypothetical protein
MLDFIYDGEAVVENDRLTRFLSVAENLKIEGLSSANVISNANDTKKEKENRQTGNSSAAHDMDCSTLRENITPSILPTTDAANTNPGMTCHISLDILRCNPIQGMPIKNEYSDQHITGTSACNDEKITLPEEESTARSAVVDQISNKKEKMSIWEYFKPSPTIGAFICHLCERKVIASVRSNDSLNPGNLCRHVRVQHSALYNQHKSSNDCKETHQN